MDNDIDTDFNFLFDESYHPARYEGKFKGRARKPEFEWSLLLWGVVLLLWLLAVLG